MKALKAKSKLMAAGLALLLAAFITAACQQPQAGDETAGADPVETTDDRGTEIRLQKAPDTVVCIGPINTEIMFGIGAGDLVVGADSFSDWPAEPLAEVQEVGSLEEPDIEQIAGLEPDLVLASTTGLEDIEKMEELGLTVAGFDPQGLQRTYETITRIAKLTQRQEGGERLISEMKSAFECVQQKIGEIDDPPAVFYAISPDPVWTAGAGSFPDEMIDMAGASNIFDDLQQAWAEVDSEAVIERDPAIILTGTQQTVDMIDEGHLPGWDEISAVRDGRVEVIDADLMHRPGPRLVLGFAQMARAIWPELPEELDCMQDYRTLLQQWTGQ